MILRDCLFMLKMLKSGFISFWQEKRSPQVPNLVMLPDYPTSQGGMPVLYPKPGKGKAVCAVSRHFFNASVHKLLKV